jgi:hypothetical protein
MSFITSLLGLDEENVQAGEEADRRLAQLNAQRAAQLAAEGRAVEGERYLAETQANLDRSRIDADHEVYQAFGEGLDEGAANIRGAISSTVGTALQTPFKLVPWWILLLGGVAVALWFFGPPAFLKRA